MVKRKGQFHCNRKGKGKTLHKSPKSTVLNCFQTNTHLKAITLHFGMVIFSFLKLQYLLCKELVNKKLDIIFSGQGKQTD